MWQRCSNLEIAQTWGKLQHTEIDRSLTCLPDKVLPEPASDRIRLRWHVRVTKLQSKLFRERGSELHMAAGEAHWASWYGGASYQCAQRDADEIG